MIGTMTDDLQKKINEWLDWDQNPVTSNSIQTLIESGQHEELERILMNRIAFGTAGLRGRMGAGYASMNDLVVIQTAQGLLKYLEKSHFNVLQKGGLVVGYDGRHNSKRFAELTASIFLHAGYPVRLFSKMVPTPFIPFTVRLLECAAGVMVTASHNPKEDNGYKVYGFNGAQIISPTDKQIHKEIMANLKPFPTSWDSTPLTNKASTLLSDPLHGIFSEYVKIIQKSLLPQHEIINRNENILFTYTPMHGVGCDYIEKILDAVSIQFVAVEEQMEPDPEFSTVKFPNPEEGKSSLDLSFKTADRNSSPIVIANDPDADRLAAAEKQENGEWRVFNGNELGALLGWWSLYCFKIRYPNENLDNIYMLSSTVSSMILKSMASSEGFHFIETLTGFKWMGNKAVELLKANKKVIFAFEEAIGFMCGTAVLDKDGVSAAFQFTTMCSFLYSQKITVAKKLEEIYSIYGYHMSLNSYFICDDQVKIKRIFDELRCKKGVQNKFPTGILSDKYVITTVRDLTTGFDNSQPDNKAILPVSKSSQMITFNFSNGFVCTIRTSGTEPKIKYYTEICANPKTMDKTAAMCTLKEMVDGVVNEFLQPQTNNLTPKSDD